MIREVRWEWSNAFPLGSDMRHVTFIDSFPIMSSRSRRLGLGWRATCSTCLRRLKIELRAILLIIFAFAFSFLSEWSRQLSLSYTGIPALKVVLVKVSILTSQCCICISCIVVFIWFSSFGLDDGYEISVGWPSSSMRVGLETCATRDLELGGLSNFHFLKWMREPSKLTENWVDIIGLLFLSLNFLNLIVISWGAMMAFFCWWRGSFECFVHNEAPYIASKPREPPLPLGVWLTITSS